MAASKVRRRTRARGSIDILPSGALRVRLYAGQDPLTKKRHVLVETIPAGPEAQKQAEAALDRMHLEVSERRSPRTNATVDQLLERYLDQFSGGENTLELYRGHVSNHISPLLGPLKVGQLTPETLDSFYAELRRCRTHCTSKRRTIDHRVKGDHECDERCRPHECRPLAATTIRHIHFILSGAYKRALRWRWVSVSPTAQAEPPPAPKSNPQPPSAEEAARIINAAWRDPDWGAFLWVAMTTGARRGELCAIRWSAVNLEAGREPIWLRHAIRRSDDGWSEGDLKTHQQRRIAIDADTAEVLREHRERCESRARDLGFELDLGAFAFSNDPAGASALTPDSVTQRYDRMTDRLGIVTTLHKLRHYSATELILGGVDVRTVAGRLGHGGGGTTTLRTYTAWVSEADQRAATGLAARMPSRLTEVSPAKLMAADPRSPYERVASTLAAQIHDGTFPIGGQLPTGKEIGTTFSVATATAQRAVTLLQSWGMVAVSRGQRAIVTSPIPAAT
jgi:integrase